MAIYNILLLGLEYIYFVITLWIILLCIGGACFAMASFTAGSPQTTFIIIATGIFICTTLMLILLFGTKFFSILTKSEAATYGELSFLTYFYYGNIYNIGSFRSSEINY